MRYAIIWAVMMLTVVLSAGKLIEGLTHPVHVVQVTTVQEAQDAAEDCTELGWAPTVDTIYDGLVPVRWIVTCRVPLGS